VSVIRRKAEVYVRSVPNDETDPEYQRPGLRKDPNMRWRAAEDCKSSAQPSVSASLGHLACSLHINAGQASDICPARALGGPGTARSTSRGQCGQRDDGL
jgi:hypothetical protein